MSRGDRYEQDRYYHERDHEYERDRGGYGRGGGRDYERDRTTEDDRYYMRGARGVDVEERDRYYERDVDYNRRRPPYEEPRFVDQLARDLDRQTVLDDREREYRRPRTDFFDRRSEAGPLVRHSPSPRSRYEPSHYDDGESYREPSRDAYREEFYPPAPPRSERGPEHVHEVVRERTIERDRSPAASRMSHSHSRHSRSRSRSTSTSVSSHSGGNSVRQEYPKKGKTRIPARYVSTKIIIDLGYPYVQEGNTIIIQKALGQEHIDELLRLSEEYTKSKTELEVTVPAPPKSSAGEAVPEKREERREDIKQEVIITSPPPLQPIYIQAPAPVSAPTPPAPASVAPAPPPPAPAAPAPLPPLIVDAYPRSPGRGNVEVVDKTVIREEYPRYIGREREEETTLVRTRSRSRARSSIRADIRALERELGSSRKHHHHRHYDEDDYEVVRTERLGDGQLVVYEERVERLPSHPKPPRLEKDKKGRITLSLPAFYR